MKNKAILATLTWEEINFCKELGYRILEIFETYLYSQERPIFLDFFQLLSREKIKYSDYPGQNLDEYVNLINDQMRYAPELQLKKEEICPNSTKRQYAKDNLNLLFGKFAQQNMRTKLLVVNSQQAIEKQNLKLISDIFPLRKACLLVMKNVSKSVKHNRSANSIIYAHVLAKSRIFMYRTMQSVSKSATVYQISNDSLYLSYPKHIRLNEILHLGSTFGTFRDEYPGMHITSFVSFGPKSSYTQMKDKYGNTFQIVKAKGFSLNNVNSQKIISSFNFEEAILNSLNGQKTNIIVPQLRNVTNVSTLTINQILFMFRFSSHITDNRVIYSDGTTKAYGNQ